MMDNVYDPSKEAEIEDQAARWLARWNSGELSESEQEELEQWKQADPDHDKMFDEMRWVWAEMGLITNFLPEESLEKERDPDILVKALREIASFGSTPQIVAFFISAAAILILIG